MRKRTEAERKEFVEEWRASGKSARRWCRENDIPYTTFVNWLKRMPTTESPKTASSIQWATVTPSFETPDCPPVQSWAFLPSKVRLLTDGFEIDVEAGFDPEVLLSVLRVVKQACC